MYNNSNIITSTTIITSVRIYRPCRLCSLVVLSPVILQLSGSLAESLVPFDAASEVPLEEQRSEAMVRVQDSLMARLGPEALGLLRAARSVCDRPS